MDRARSRELALVLAVTVGALSLFLNKAFTIDDPLFLWLGRHVQDHPLDFYGFDVNWYGTSMPMHAVTKNPPLAGYGIALAAWLFGWSEVALHAAFLVPAAFAAAATYLLARRFCTRPVEATLIGILTPVFLVSSTNVMCDTTMLALWCWAVLAWIWAIDRGDWRFYVLSAVLVALASLTKYYGIALVPLCLAYGWMRRRRAGAWMLALALPIAVAAAYQIATERMYGRGLFLDAADYATNFQGSGAIAGEERPSLWRQTIVGLAFAGGSVIPALFFAPLLWTRRIAVVAVLIAAACFGVILVQGSVAGIELAHFQGAETIVAAEVVVLALAGASLLALACADLCRGRNAESALLFLWMIGTFVFAAYLNWANNGRSNLPLAPVAGILILRRLERDGAAGGGADVRARRIAFALSAATALAVAYTDFRWANGVREVAREIVRKHSKPDRTTYFEGHWGFQYYMEDAGARALIIDEDQVVPGDLLVLPSFQSGLYLPKEWMVDVIAEHVRDDPRFARTMSPSRGAGFYASKLGPLPFVFGPGAPDIYRVLEAKRGFRFSFKEE